MAQIMSSMIMKILANMTYICNTIQYNAILQMCCKFYESKWNPYWITLLTNSSGTNHVVNGHENCGQYDPNKTLINKKIMPFFRLSCKFSESKWNLHWFVLLANLSGTNHALNKHKDFEQYGPYAIPSKLIQCNSCLADLINQNEIPIL